MPSPRLVVLDNTAAEIRYGHSWAQQTSTASGSVHLGTLQATTANTTFNFQFTGTMIRAMGSINIKKVNGVQDPRWECLVDGQSLKLDPPGDGFVEDAWLLCSARDLSDSNHTFTLNAISQGSTFYFDSLWYQPSPTADLSGSVVRLENDDEAVKYNGKFGPLGDFGNMTTESGASVTAEFIGKSLTWYGFIPTELSHASATATYSIDGGSPNAFQLVGLPDGKVASRRNQVFFTTPELEPGHHNLTVTHGGDGSKTPLVLDYLLVANSTSVASHHSEKAVPVGAIVGGVIGGLVFLIGLCYAVYYFTRRRELASRWRRRTMRSIDASFSLPETETLDEPRVNPRRMMPSILRANHRPSPSDASVTAPLFSADHDHQLDSHRPDHPREPISSAAAYTSHNDALFSYPPDTAGTVDTFNLTSPTESTRGYEQARTMLALQGPTKGALQAVSAATRPMVVHNQHLDSGYRITMKPNQHEGDSLVQVVDVPPGYSHM